MNGLATMLEPLITWLAMGGYGLYVWGSVGMCAAVIAGELLALRAQRDALAREANPAGSDLDAVQPAPRRGHTLTRSEAEA